MKDFIEYIREYASLLQEGSIWSDSKDILAPVITVDNAEVAADNYIYEFYCYISIIIDLRKNYSIKFIEGEGSYKYKFPQAAAIKKGKPRFHAFTGNDLMFQICAGTKILCPIDSEENHPDISFQLPDSSDNPTEGDLIIIMDAKFKEISDSLPKSEVYKFGTIVDLFDLRRTPKVEILFCQYKGFESNCLITNGKAYSDAGNVQFLNRYWIKEIENFYPGKAFKVVG